MPQMVRMIATAEHQYAGHRLRIGEQYDCEEQHVSLMATHRWSRPVERATESPQIYETRVMTAGRRAGKGRGK